MSLRIEPVLTQACYIIGCSEKRKKCLRNQMDLKCSIINKHFFFFFFAFVLVPIPKYSATENLLKKVWKGQKSLLAFLETVPSATAPKELEEMAGAVSLTTSFSLCYLWTYWRRRGAEEVWGRLVVIMTRGNHGFRSWEVCKLIPSKLQATISPLLSIQMTVADIFLTGSGSPVENMAPVYFRPSIFPHLPLLPSS